MFPHVRSHYRCAPGCWRRFAPGLPLLLGLGLLAGCLAPATTAPELAARLDEILNRHSATGATYAARVVALPGGEELYAHEADTPVIPASNMKLPVSAAALDLFGAEHAFKTYLCLDGGNLWIIGTGDPALGDPRLAKRAGRRPTSVFDDWADAVAAALRARGMRSIPGELIYYDGALDAEWVHASWGDSTLHWYGAPVTGLNFNDNCVDITIHPTVAGQAVRYEIMPPAPSLSVVNGCISTTDAAKHAPTIEKLPGGNVYRLGGTCAQTEELMSKPVDDPGAFLADALRYHFAQRGIEIAGPNCRAAVPLSGGLEPPAETIVAVHATPLADVLGRINTNSQNLFAEAACKLVGRGYAGGGSGAWSEGGAAIRAFLQRNGIDDRGLNVADGSGLSVENRVTARLISDLLVVMSNRPDVEVFRNSLAQGGVNGTLEKRFAGFEGRVFAKTGYIGGVRALSGYVRTERAGWLAFSIIYNNIPGEVKPFEELQDEAVRLLAE